MLIPEVFIDPDTQTPVRVNLISKGRVRVPPQVPEGYTDMFEAVMSSAETLSSSSGVIFGLNLLGGVGLRQIWKAINILQFIIYADDWKIAPPANL